MTRTPIVVRLPPELLKKLDRLTRQTRKKMGGSWSRNDQICLVLTYWEPPELDEDKSFGR